MKDKKLIFTTNEKHFILQYICYFYNTVLMLKTWLIFDGSEVFRKIRVLILLFLMKLLAYIKLFKVSVAQNCQPTDYFNNQIQG